jgi:hypothetical protein
VIESGETLNGPVAEPFTTYPQPDAATTRQHAKIANNHVHKPLGLRIGPRRQAQYKENTNVTSVKLQVSEADKEEL